MPTLPPLLLTVRAAMPALQRLRWSTAETPDQAKRSASVARAAAMAEGAEVGTSPLPELGHALSHTKPGLSGFFCV